MSIFCVDCKSLLVEDENIVEIRRTPIGPEVLASNGEDSQLQVIGWALSHPSHSETMQRRGYFGAEIMKQKVVCRCHYELEKVKEYYNLKKFNAGYVLFNKEDEGAPFSDGFTGCVIRYGLNGTGQLVWKGCQSDHALLNYEDGKLMGRQSGKA